MTDHVERIAVLEAEVNTLKSNQDKILSCMEDIKGEMTRYKGFLGGIAFLSSGIVIFITIFKDWVFKHIG